jgi:hypothetical protein
MYRTATLPWFLFAFTAAGQSFHPDVPRAWDDGAVAAFQMPLVQRDRTPRYLSSKEYYALTGC